MVNIGSQHNIWSLNRMKKVKILFYFMSALVLSDSLNAKTLAKVGRFEINEQTLAAYLESESINIESLNEKQKRELIEKIAIEFLLYERALRENLTKDSKLKSHEQILVRNFYSQTMYNRLLEREYTKEALDKKYEDMKTTYSGEEYNFFQIITRKEDEAKQLIIELKNGKDFAKLANEKSITTVNRKDGGNLGWQTMNLIIPEAINAASALKVGEYFTEPVHSSRGWVVLKLNEKRPYLPPPQEEVLPQLKKMIQMDKNNQILQNLKKEISVEVY